MCKQAYTSKVLFAVGFLIFQCPFLIEKLFATSKYTHRVMLFLSFLLSLLEKMRGFGCSVMEEKNHVEQPFARGSYDGTEWSSYPGGMTSSIRLGIIGTASGSWAYSCLQNRFAACLGALHRLPASLSPCKGTADTQPHQRSPRTEVSSESLLWWGMLSCLNAQAALRCSWGEESCGQGTRHSPGHSSLVPADPAELHSCRHRHLETAECCLYLTHLQTRRKHCSLTYVSYFYLGTGHGSCWIRRSHPWLNDQWQKHDLPIKVCCQEWEGIDFFPMQMEISRALKNNDGPIS